MYIITCNGSFVLEIQIPDESTGIAIRDALRVAEADHRTWELVKIV